jgi:acyl-CoA synthetase (AMP-forming)/AMP-acid ligase II
VQVEHFVVFADAAPPGWTTWADWLDGRDPDLKPDLKPDRFDVEDIAVQIYTSGTTGRPKGAMVSHRAITSFLHRWQLQGMRLAPGQTFYLSMPVTMAAGFNCAVNAWMQGATVLIANFDADRAAVALDSGVSATALAPTMIKRVIESPAAKGRSYDGLAWVLYGAAPIAAPVLKQAMGVLGCDFYQALGQTEAATITLLSPEDHQRAMSGDEWLLGSVGRVQLGAEVAILDVMTGEPVKPGEVGEICVRGPWVMSGYWRRPESIERIRAGEWHHTSDVGYVDQEGYLFVVDRLDDAVVTGGYNVYPREVERVLEEHAGVSQVAVFGVTSDEWGQELVAAVVAAGDARLHTDLLVEHCRAQLAGYKVPRRFAFVDELPTNSNGKILKRVLRDDYAPASASVAKVS